MLSYQLKLTERSYKTLATIKNSILFLLQVKKPSKQHKEQQKLKAIITKERASILET